MDGTPEDLRQRTKRFALRIIGVCDRLGERGKGGVISRQLIKCGTSVGAQFREAKRARSDAEFISKVESATQELEETLYWLELIVEGEILPARRMMSLTDEAEQLMRILVTVATKVKARQRVTGRRGGGR